MVRVIAGDLLLYLSGTQANQVHKVPGDQVGHEYGNETHAGYDFRNCRR